MQGNVQDDYVNYAFKIYQLNETFLPRITAMKILENHAVVKYKIPNEVKLNSEVINKFFNDFIEGNYKYNKYKYNKY